MGDSNSQNKAQRVPRLAGWTGVAPNAAGMMTPTKDAKTMGGQREEPGRASEIHEAARAPTIVIMLIYGSITLALRRRQLLKNRQRGNQKIKKIFGSRPGIEPRTTPKAGKLYVIQP